MFSRDSFRTREIPYPRTYIVLKKQKELYLLCWLEYGEDGSLYVWLDDDLDNSWEVVSTHNQTGIVGEEVISFKGEKLQIFDPHLSWHKSGRVHVSGYDYNGRKGARLISDRQSDSLEDLRNGATAPFTQIVFPNLDGSNFLKCLSLDLKEDFGGENCVCFVTGDGLKVLNDNANGEAFLVIDREEIPKGVGLAIDIGVFHKENDPQFIGSKKTLESLLFPAPKIISSYKESSVSAAAIRLFKMKVLDDASRASSAVATCFNKESIDLFLFRRK